MFLIKHEFFLFCVHPVKASDRHQTLCWVIAQSSCQPSDIPVEFPTGHFRALKRWCLSPSRFDLNQG